MFSRSRSIGNVARCYLLKNKSRIGHQRVRNVASNSTVNADEIEHFSRLSEQWWDEGGEFAMLHKMNPVRARFIRDRVLRVRHDEGMPLDVGLEGLEAVDVGCGGGLLSEVWIIFYVNFLIDLFYRL